jgi:LTXXQ motif family protein
MKRSITAAILAVGLSGVAFIALAQPRAGAPMHAFGDPLAAIAAVKAQLGLSDTQQAQWDSAVAQSKAAHQAARTNFSQLKAATQAELAKPAPDLAALAALADDVQEQNVTARRVARDAWLALYASLSQEQKTIVRDAIQAKLDRMAAFRAQLRERLAP